MNSYHDLGEGDKEALLRFPAYISLLAANYHNNGIDKKEKDSAISFTHIKTFSSDPLLREFFQDVERHFEDTITELNNELPKNKRDREVSIKRELNRLEIILKSLGTPYAMAMHNSMNEYKEHVAHAHQSLMEYLIFPVPIKGLTY